MFANGERDWCRHVKVNIESTDRQVERDRERERERETERERENVCVLFEFRQFFFFFFTLETRIRISKFCVDLCKNKSDRTRCLAVSILQYNLGPKITGSEVQY